jgi:predicted enzyme related to lactoylglutathione lyase
MGAGGYPRKIGSLVKLQTHRIIKKIMKKRVTGLGGFFFKSEDPEATKSWYARHLGLPVDTYGCTFWWKDQQGKDCSTHWGPMKEDTAYFSPSQKQFMMNFRVENLEELLEALRGEGVQIIGETESYEYGKFGWIMDPEGNKIELWEPVDKEFQK